jgi:hypothetical protein
MTASHGDDLAALSWAAEAVEDAARRLGPLRRLAPLLGADLARRLAALLPLLRRAEEALLPAPVEQEHCPLEEADPSVERSRWFERRTYHSAILRGNGELWLREGPAAPYRLVLEYTDAAGAEAWLRPRGDFKLMLLNRPQVTWDDWEAA